MSMVIIYILGAVFTQRNDDFGGFCFFSGKSEAHLRGLEVGFAKKISGGNIAKYSSIRKQIS
jgi:hypothetical protein